MLRKLSFLATLVGPVVLCVLLPASAAADLLPPTGIFTVNDLTDTVTVATDSSNAGRLFTDCSGESCFFSIEGITNAVSFSASFGSTTFTGDTAGVNMLEPGFSDKISDTLRQTDSNNAKTFWQFNSDCIILSAETDTVTSFPTLVENGTPQPTILITYFDSNSTEIGTSLIDIASDVETPEPSLGLAALAGLLMIVGVAFLRRRTA
jgi:hypothetical protein